VGDTYTGERRRAEDLRLSWRIASTWHEWGWAFALISALIAAGFIRFWSPIAAERELHTQIASEVAPLTARVSYVESEVDTIKIRQEADFADRTDMRKVLEFLARTKCTEMSLTEQAKLGGTEVCDAVQHPLDHAIKARIRAPGEPLP